MLNGCEQDGALPPSTCPTLRIIAAAPYGYPVWHPSQGIIGFNYVPLRRISLFYDGECLRDVDYEYEMDSSGFWTIREDGTEMKRILPFFVNTPQWSPDGQWLVFNLGLDIYKIRFNAGAFDTNSIIRLTSEGRNFFPAWSGDGNSVSYWRSFAYPEPVSVSGIYVMDRDGNNSMMIMEGYLPDPSWNPKKPAIIFFGYGESAAGVPGDTLLELELSDTTTVPFFEMHGDNYSPRFSPDATEIAFMNQPYGQALNLWIYTTETRHLQRMTTDGCASSLTWSPTGEEIAYVSFRSDDFTYGNGTIWILNRETLERRQLTFNVQPDSTNQVIGVSHQEE